MVRSCLAGVVSLWILAMGAPQAKDAAPELKLILPSVAREGETFTGMIVERAPDGLRPAGPGVFQFGGKSLRVGTDGRITIPTRAGRDGNFQFEGKYDDDGPGAPVAGLRAHVELIRTSADSPAAIHSVGEIYTGAMPLRIRGTALDKLKSCSLKSPGGANYPLPERCGSSLEQVCVPTGSNRIPPQSYSLVAQTTDGKSLQAPKPVVCPRVRVDGSDIKQRGDRGEFTLTTTADTWIRLEGGEGMITLDRRHAFTRVENPAKIGFRADGVGLYTMKAVPVSSEERDPERDSPKVQCKTDTPTCTPSADGTGTAAECPIEVTDGKGKPLANSQVNVAVSDGSQVRYGTCTTDERGKSVVRVDLVGKIAASQLRVHPYGVPGHDWNKPGDPTILIDDGGGGDEDLHHCQGHRLAVIIGPNTDRSIAGAAEQMRTMTGIQHKLWIDVSIGGNPSMSKARVPVADGSRWGGMDGSLESIVAGYADCCFWDEIIVISHGGQSGLWRSLIAKLPVLLNSRPVRKVTFWVCEASASVYPNNGNNQRVFEKIVYALRPRDCPCHCNPANCRAFDANARPTQCPTRTSLVKMYMAGTVAIPGRADGYANATRLGMNVGPPLQLTSGDGRISETTITDTQAGAPFGAMGATSKAQPDPNITTTTTLAGPGLDVFNGLTVQADASLVDKSEAMNPAKRTEATTGFKPKDYSEPAYSGPDANRVCPHAGKEGCLPRSM